MASSVANRIADFCSGFPDQLFGVNYSFCCFAHDWAYASFTPKVEADLDLALCVSKVGLPAIGLLMLAGVTLFGWLFYPRKKRT